MLVFLCLLLLVAVWVAIPLIPAILIYRIFPPAPLRARKGNALPAAADHAAIAGKLPGTGLTINASGATAAYLIVFLIIMPVVDKAEKRIGGLDKPYWEITAVARFVDDTGKEIEPPDELLKDMELKAAPSNLSHNDSLLTLKIPEEVARSFPESEFPFPIILNGTGFWI